jgi:hypothetical protein
MKALDFSTDFPDRFPADAVELGYNIFIMYLGYGSKVATPSRISRILEAGGRIALVWEVTGGAAGFGIPSGPEFFTLQRGREDATEAINQATRLGYKPGCVIFYAVDVGITAEQCVEYFNGIKQIHDEHGMPYSIGSYGDFSVETAKWPAVPYRWQTLAWSGGQVGGTLNLYQDDQITIDGVQCDINEIMSPDISWSWGKEDILDPEKLAEILNDPEFVKKIWTFTAIKDVLAAQADAINHIATATDHVSDAELARIITIMGLALQKVGADVAPK